MTDLEVYRPAELAVHSDIDSWTHVAGQVIKLANEIYDTPFVPDGLRGSVPATAAAILAGRELGLGPMTSLASIHVIKGKTGLSAALMRALILTQGHQIETVDISDTRCLIRGRRKGESSWEEAGFTADQAKRAGIQLGGYPQDKLYARATSRLARRKFADVIAGMPYSAEELEDGPDGAAPADVPAATPQPAQRTARRGRSAPPIVPPADAASPVAAASPAPPPQAGTAGGTPLPPLPGEEDSGPAPSGQPAGHEPAPGPEAAAKAVGDMFERLATHVDHELKQEGRCVYCVTCNERLYQGRMWTAKDRDEIRESMRQKAATPEPDDTDYDTPGTATRGKGGQLTAIWTVLSMVFGFSNEEKPQARGVCEHIIGRPLVGGTTGNLSFNEARTVLDTLANWQKLAEGDETPPRQVLVALMAAGGSDAD